MKLGCLKIFGRSSAEINTAVELTNKFYGATNGTVIKTLIIIRMFEEYFICITGEKSIFA